MRIKRWMVSRIVVLASVLVMAPVYAGGEIAYLAIHKNYWQVWLMDADGKNQKPLTDTPYDKSRISWYPDKKALLVSGNQGELVKLSLDDPGELPVTLVHEKVNDAVISLDGQYMAYSYKPKGSIFNKLVIRHLKSDNVDNIAWAQPGFQHEPVFSPDSGSLYFLSGDNKQSHDIWRYDIKTRSLTQETAGSLYNFDVSVSADNTLLFSSNRSGNYDIWIKAKGKTRQLTQDRAMDGRPVMSVDGQHIYYESNHKGVLNVWIMDTAGKTPPHQLTNHEQGARHPIAR